MDPSRLSRRVVVTGIGVICAVGHNTAEVWSALLAGKSGVARITAFDASQFACQIAAQVKNFDPLQFLDKKEARKMARFIHLAIAASDEALRMAHYKVENEEMAERTGVNIGSGIGGFDIIQREQSNLLNRALATRNDDPHRASRPWDKDRDGFIIGEGSGILILEELESARKRGAKIIAEVVGYGMSADANHITQPAQNGEGGFRVMRNAMRDAGISPERIGYVNAHGTSTPIGDELEATAIKRAFGDHAYKMLVESTKSMTGHLLGGAGGLEAAITVLALRDQIAPPTVKLDNPGEGCDLDFVPNAPRKVAMEYAMSNSFGFGGTNGCLVFRRWTE